MTLQPESPVSTFARVIRMLPAMVLCLATLPPAMAASSMGADYFSNIVLTTQDGKQVRFYDDLLKGKSVAINVIYTSCTDECPLETARMSEVQRLLGARMGRDILFYSISIDPEHDTPAVLKAYAQKFGVGPGWLFLTGKKEDITALTKKLGLSRTSDLANRDGHASSLMLGNEPTGQWMRNSAVDNPRFLAASMSTFFGWPDLAAAPSYAQALPVDMGRAEILFQSRCASCHSVGGGDKIGPDLQGVAQRRDPAWLARFIREPEKVLAEGDATAVALFQKYKQVRMPNLRLGDEEVASLVAYIDAGTSKPASHVAAEGHEAAHVHHKH
ncbi:MAG: SCO family protein [Herminiimonas sp.]|nr:SCO family protein [Herminiimonas sp.]